MLKQIYNDIKTEDVEIKTYSSAIDVFKKELHRKETILIQNQGFDALFDRIVSLKNRSDVLVKSNLLLSSINEAKSTSETVSESLRTVNKQINAIPFEKLFLEIKRFTELSILMEDTLKFLCKIKSIQERQYQLQKKLKFVSYKHEIIVNAVYRIQKKIKALTLLKEFVSNIIEKQNDIRTILTVCQKKKTQLYALPKTVLSTSQQKALQNRIEQAKDISNWLIQRRQEIAEIKAIAYRIGTVQSTLNDVKQRFNKADKEFTELKNNLGVCPFCGSVFDYGDNKHFHLTEEEHT